MAEKLQMMFNYYDNKIKLFVKINALQKKVMDEIKKGPAEEQVEVQPETVPEEEESKGE